MGEAEEHTAQDESEAPATQALEAIEQDPPACGLLIEADHELAKKERRHEAHLSRRKPTEGDSDTRDDQEAGREEPYQETRPHGGHDEPATAPPPQAEDDRQRQGSGECRREHDPSDHVLGSSGLAEPVRADREEERCDHVRQGDSEVGRDESGHPQMGFGCVRDGLRVFRW